MPDQPLSTPALLPALATAPLPDPWQALRQHTPARIALGRTGASLPVQEMLRLQAAHAQARDAIDLPLDSQAIADRWLSSKATPDMPVLQLASEAADRATYLLRPDKGRRLDAPSVAAINDFLQNSPAPPPDLLLVVGDGLSALGIQQHSLALLEAICQPLAALPLRIGPLIVVRHARVAIADEIGEKFKARLTAILIGERPGLSSPDSIGIYLTLNPLVGCSDAQRNCISNIRPAGQSLHSAAARLAWLVQEALRIGATGVALKDHSGVASALNFEAGV